MQPAQRAKARENDIGTGFPNARDCGTARQTGRIDQSHPTRRIGTLGGSVAQGQQVCKVVG